MFKKEYYNVAAADYNRDYIINEEAAYNKLTNIFKRVYRFNYTDNQAYHRLKPYLDKIVSTLEYSEGFERYRGWKHDLAKELIEYDYNDFKDWEKVLKERDANNGI